MSKTEKNELFHSIPVRIDILNSRLQLTTSVFLLGDQDKKTKQLIADNGIYSKQVESIFGKNFISTEHQHSIKGGDIDWDELDDEDFETIINAEDIKVSEIEEEDSNNIIEKDIKVSEIIDYNTIIYKEDTIINVQKKISLITKIEPIKQYIAKDNRAFNSSNECLTHYINFHSSFDSHIDNVDLVEYLYKSNSNTHSSSITKIKDIPIDESYLMTKDSSSIINTQYNKLFEFLDSTDDTCIRIILISLDSIITNKVSINYLLRSDRQSFELIFESFIERFYIMITTQIFTNYLSNEITFDINKYKSIISNQNKIIKELNNIPKVSIKDNSLTIVTNALTLHTDSNHIAFIVLQKLFNSFVLNDVSNVFYLDLFISLNNKLTNLRKVSKYAAQSINLVENISMNIKPLAVNLRDYRHKDRLVITLLPSNNFSKLIISIDMFGHIEICAYSNRNTEITKKLFLSEITLYIKPIIDYLNQLNDGYLSQLRLNADLDSYKMTKSTSNLIFNKRIDYDHAVKYMINDLSNTGLLEVEVNANVNIKTRLFKIYSYSDDINNTMMNLKSNKHIQIYSNSRLAVFILFDLSIEETIFYVDLIGRFINLRSNEIEIKVGKKNNVQSSDPVLYKYKNKANMNYSRVCQKKFQPILADPSDKKAIKYHNFTFNEPQYYKCPTKENPFIGLISGYHPNGYCLPCCRKTEQSNFENISNSCIKGDTIEDLSKTVVKANSHLYVIDYPNDMIANSRIVSRLANVPDFINKMLTKGSKLLVNGISINYNETQLDFQIINILTKFLNKKSFRDLILDILEFLKNIKNHRKILSMPNISYSFTNIQDLINNLINKFLKQVIIKSTYNWNEIIIDISIAMDIGIVLLSDNRIRASDCDHIVNYHGEECTTEPINSINASIKMLKLEYVDLDKPIILILRRVDTEYSKINNNRRYYYFPLISSNIIEIKIDTVLPTVISQLKKIKSINQQSITNIIDKSFNYNTLEQSIQGIGKIKTLYEDIDNYVAYSDIVIGASKTLLISLYRTPSLLLNNNQQPLLKRYQNQNQNNYTGNVVDIIKLLENHNQLQLTSIEHISSFKDYLLINFNLLLINKLITLPICDKYLLKIDKFIIHQNKVIGTKIVAINGKQIIHSNIIYHKHMDIIDITKLIKSTSLNFLELKSKKLTINDAKFIATIAFDLIKRTKSIGITNSYSDYFIEYFINPITLIDRTPEPVNYPNTELLNRANYMSNIYKIMISTMIEYWKTNKPIEFLEAIKKLIEETKPDILKNLSNNLIENWIDQLSKLFINKYHPNIIKAEMYEFSSYIQSNVLVKTKESIIKALFDNNIPINDIELHNIAFTHKTQIKQLVEETASKCLSKTNTIPTIIFNNNQKKNLKINQSDSVESDTNIQNISMFEYYRDSNDKLLILNSIYSDLLNLAIVDLSNPFRREYILNNCMINNFVNTIKIKSHIDELIYMQEL